MAGLSQCTCRGKRVKSGLLTVFFMKHIDKTIMNQDVVNRAMITWHWFAKYYVNKRNKPTFRDVTSDTSLDM